MRRRILRSVESLRVKIREWLTVDLNTGAIAALSVQVATCEDKLIELEATIEDLREAVDALGLEHSGLCDRVDDIDSDSIESIRDTVGGLEDLCEELEARECLSESDVDDRVTEILQSCHASELISIQEVCEAIGHALATCRV